jgi:hypothetical protein
VVSCFVAFRLEIILIVKASSLSFRKVWITVSSLPFGRSQRRDSARRSRAEQRAEPEAERLFLSIGSSAGLCLPFSALPIIRFSIEVHNGNDEYFFVHNLIDNSVRKAF